MTDRPSWFSRLNLSRCQEHFDTVETFARENGRIEQLYKTLSDLVWGDIPDDELTCFGTRCKVRVHMYKDFAPESFQFDKEVLYDGKEEWKYLHNGGVIFHGTHDGGGNGGAPTYSVNLTPQDGWSVHT